MGAILSTISSNMMYGAGFIILISLCAFFVILWSISGSPFSSAIPPDTSGSKALTNFWLLILAWGIFLPLAVIAFLYVIFFGIIYVIAIPFSGRSPQPTKKYSRLANNPNV